MDYGMITVEEVMCSVVVFWGGSVGCADRVGIGLRTDLRYMVVPKLFRTDGHKTDTRIANLQNLPILTNPVFSNLQKTRCGKLFNPVPGHHVFTASLDKNME